MAARKSSGGLSTLLGLIAVGLIIAGIIYAVKEDDAPKEKPRKPKVVRQEPQRHTADSIADSLGLGDGRLGKASSVSASDMGEARAVSGGGAKSKSSSKRKSSRRSTRSSPTRRSGG